MQAELIAAATCADECKWFHNVLSTSSVIFGKLSSIPLLVDRGRGDATEPHMFPESEPIPGTAFCPETLRELTETLHIYI